MTGRRIPQLVQVAAAVVAVAVCACQTGKPFNPYAATGTTSAELVKTGARGVIEPSMLKPPTEPFRLGPGDVVDIELLGSAEGPQRLFVGPDGKLYFLFLPGQQAWGMTLPETRALLEREMAKFVRNPQVNITLREVHSRRVWVLGRVNTPGLYDLAQPMTLLEAVSKAGGLFTSRMSGSTEEMADLYQSFVIRKGKLLPVNFHRLIREGDTRQNIYLQADDFIYLPSALGSEVYVLGAVNQPRAVAFKDQVTLVSAIAHCRGFHEDAKPGRVAIVRGSLTEPSIAVVDADKILKGQAPDVLLKPRDIVYVPGAAPLALGAYAELVVNTFARTVAANEGTRAAGGRSGVGVNIGIGQ